MNIDMKKLIPIQFKALLLIMMMAVCCFSCKKAAQESPVKNVVLVTDSITQGQYTLIFENEDTTYQKKGDDSRKALEKTFFTVYPEITAYFNPNAPHRVVIKIDPSYSEPADVAVTVNATITLNPSWVLQNQADIDVITHESTHVAQQYKSAGYTPTWLVEGLADYSRNKFGVNNAAVGWYIPNYSVGDQYTDGYTTVAGFILWAEAKYQPGIAQTLDKQLRAGTYSDDDSWMALTGSTFSQLWNTYVLNPYY
jgi:hypothetical protein